MSTGLNGWLLPCLVIFLAWSAAAQAETRSETHAKYAADLWEHVKPSDSDYTEWTVADELPAALPGPPCGENAKTYLNAKADRADGSYPVGAVLVTEHVSEGDGAKPLAITIRYRAKSGYYAASDDWYWAHYLPDGTLLKTVADKTPYGRSGFVTFEEDGRLWIFRTASPALADFVASGDLGKRVIRPGAGPGGMTVMSDENETIDAYLTVKPGFVTEVVDGRLWVFQEDSEELAEFRSGGELAKHVIRPAAGPGGVTVKAPDAETIEAYMAAADGFVTEVKDGRIWVFRPNSTEWKEFQETGEPAKQVIRPGAGPLGMTVKSADAETIDAYLRVCAQ